MPTCRSCGIKWNWSTAALASLSLKEGKICPHCQEKQYLSTRSKKRSGLIAMLPMIILFLFNVLFDLDATAAILLSIPLIAFVFAVLPFTMELSNDLEPLW